MNRVFEIFGVLMLTRRATTRRKRIRDERLPRKNDYSETCRVRRKGVGGGFARKTDRTSQPNVSYEFDVGLKSPTDG